MLTIEERQWRCQIISGIRNTEKSIQQLTESTNKLVEGIDKVVHALQNITTSNR